MFVDLNGDGLRDIVRPGSPGWVRWSTGAGYGPKQDLTSGPYLDGNATAGMDQGEWLVSLPETVTYVAMDNSPTFIGGVKHVPEPCVVQYTHDDLGFLKAIHVEPAALDPHEKSTTTFERNADGLVTMITSEAPGEAPRHVSIDYDDAEGIFPVKVWNDLGYTRGFAFHPAYGVLAVARDEKMISRG